MGYGSGLGGYGASGGNGALTRRASRPVATRPRGGFGSGVSAAVTYVAIIWAVFLVDQVLFAGHLAWLGVQPRDPASLWHVLTAPWIHASSAHIISNTAPGLVFSFIIGVTNKRAWWEVTGIVMVVGGLGVWFFAQPGTTHVGASTLIYGWFSYLLVRGFFNRSLGQFLTGLLVGAAYSGLVWGVLPTSAAVSWEGHLFGAIGGVIAGMVITSDDPIKKVRTAI